MQEVMKQQAQTSAALREMSTGMTNLGNLVQTLVHTLNTNVETTTRDALTQRNITVDKSVELTVKRLDTFKGDDFLNWRFKFEMTVRSTMNKAGPFLDLIDKHAKDNTQLTQEVLRQHGQEAVDLASNFYYILAQRVEKEAMDLLRNVEKQSGAEAYRVICLRFDNRTKGKNIHLVRKVVNPGKAKKLSDMPTMMDAWESSLRRLSYDFDCKVLEAPECGPSRSAS